MSRIFLDVDGVLNDHRPMRNKYCQLTLPAVQRLRFILRKRPDCKIVLSSAWRYLVHGEAVSLRGFEYILCLFGMDFFTINGRIIGITESDEDTCVRLGLAEPGAPLCYRWLKENGCQIRAEQIYHYAESNCISRFAVLDDLELGMPELVRTDGKIGLTQKNANQVLAKLAEDTP